MLFSTLLLPPGLKYNEDELVMMLRRREAGAFSYLYDNYAPALNAVITRMVDEPQLAEDILQECFLRIWNNFSQYDATKGRLFTWLVNLTRNLTIDTLRSKGYKKQKQISKDENSVIQYQDRNYTSEKFDTIGIRQKLSNLKPEQQKIIEMAYFNGFTQEEISKELGIPLGTVKTRMRAAIMELRKIIGLV